MKEREYPFKIGQRVKLLSDGTGVTSLGFNRGAKSNDI